jgi:hypothetical protein
MIFRSRNWPTGKFSMIFWNYFKMEQNNSDKKTNRNGTFPSFPVQGYSMARGAQEGAK